MNSFLSCPRIHHPLEALMGDIVNIQNLTINLESDDSSDSITHEKMKYGDYPYESGTEDEYGYDLYYDTAYDKRNN